MTTSISDITVTTMDGQSKSMGDYAGNVLLIVNVASYCGYTGQYKGLENLNQTYKDQGLRVLGFPCNDFGAQEPGSNEEIQTFCDRNYGVTFELFDKVKAIGATPHPLYQRLSNAVEPKGSVGWNFEKFLVNKKGEVVARYKSGITPEDSEIVAAIAREVSL
jgi:glutathione peroxidase